MRNEAFDVDADAHRQPERAENRLTEGADDDRDCVCQVSLKLEPHKTSSCVIAPFNRSGLTQHLPDRGRSESLMSCDTITGLGTCYALLARGHLVKGSVGMNLGPAYLLADTGIASHLEEDLVGIEADLVPNRRRQALEFSPVNNKIVGTRFTLRLVGIPLVIGMVALNYWLLLLLDQAPHHPISLGEIFVALGSLVCAFTGIFLLVLGKKIFPSA